MIRTIYDIPEHIFKTSYQNATIGHVLTPPKLALEMIETLPSDFIKSGIKILDPACKNGSFLFQLVIKQLDNEWTIKDIENSLYTCDTLNASLNIAESGIKHIIRFPYQNSLIKINNLLYKHIEIELVYDNFIKTITKNKYISIRTFINELLLDRKNNWLIVKFEENLIEFIKKYEGLSKTESKLFGEVFTPQALIEEMLDTLPDDVWKNKDLKWLDPAVGIGNFPAAILNRLMDGLKDVIVDSDKRRKHILEEMIYMGDISTKNLFLLYQLFDSNNEFKLNVFRGDFLSDKFDKQMVEWGLDGFDLVVGNPPYQTSDATGDNKLYLEFSKKSVDILVDNGYLLYITPKNIMDYILLCDKNRNYFKDFYQIEYLAIDTPLKYFKGVGSTFIYFLLQKTKYFKKTNLKYLKNDLEIKSSILLKIGESVPNIVSDLDISIINKIKTKNNIYFDFKKMKINNREFRIRGKQIKDGIVSLKQNDIFKYPVIDGINKSNPFPGKLYYMKTNNSDNISKIIINGSGYLCPSYDNSGIYFLSDNISYLEINNINEYKSFLNIYNSKIFNYWLTQFRLNGFSDAINIRKFTNMDISKSWTDQELYEYFNLTIEEIQLVEDTISEPTKKKKSKKK